MISFVTFVESARHEVNSYTRERNIFSKEIGTFKYTLLGSRNRHSFIFPIPNPNVMLRFISAGL